MQPIHQTNLVVTNLLLSQSTTHRTGLLNTKICGQVLSSSKMLLQLQVKFRSQSYGSSLLMAENSQSTSNVLANNLDLSELGRSTVSDLSNTQLDIRTIEKEKYLRKFLFVLLNLTHQLVTILLAKFNSLCLGYKIRILSIQLSTHFSISVAIFGSRE